MAVSKIGIGVPWKKGSPVVSPPLSRPPAGAPPAAPDSAPPVSAPVSARPAYASMSTGGGNLPVSGARGAAMNRVLDNFGAGRPNAAGTFFNRLSNALTQPTASIATVRAMVNQDQAERASGTRPAAPAPGKIIVFPGTRGGYATGNDDGSGGGGYSAGGGGAYAPEPNAYARDGSAWNENGYEEGDGSPSDTYETDAENGEGAFVDDTTTEEESEGQAAPGPRTTSTSVRTAPTGILAWLNWIFGDGPKPGSRMVRRRTSSSGVRSVAPVGPSQSAVDALSRGNSEDGDEMSTGADMYVAALNGLGGGLTDFLSNTGSAIGKGAAVTALTAANNALTSSGGVPKQVSVAPPPPMSTAKKVAIGVVIGVPLLYVLTSMRRKGATVTNPRRRRRRRR